MSTVVDCPDRSTCPGVRHEWTPEPTVIHKPRVCLRGLRQPTPRPDFIGDLAVFLLTRIAEDEANADWFPGTKARVLAECEAKRRIVDYATRVCLPSVDIVLGELALPYLDHPDYRKEWKP